MVFDKTKAMRNAEKFLAQGKIRAAINEYKQVVENDSRDFGTMNMLGDLYAKASDPKNAVRCYSFVAEHYSKQGFAQKAIAVYNKISKIQPDSMAVSEKLAELYKVKGSVSEAKSHYVVLAENYQAKGRMVEALAMWKQIAILDPNNTEVYLTIAESFFKENQFSEAVDSYCEGGARLFKKAMHEQALVAYTKALDIQPTNATALAGFVDLQFLLGHPEAAAVRLESILAEQPFNRDVLYLLIDCLLQAGRMAEAEKSVIKLVEQEPANYPKFLELANVYLANGDQVSASRVLNMASEHLLAGGQADDFEYAVKEVLKRDPEQLDGLRLYVRLCTWQRDEEALLDSLKRLADASKRENAVDDERFALSQLSIIVPHEVKYAERLKEINELHGFVGDPVTDNLFDRQFLREAGQGGAKATGEVLAATAEPVEDVVEADEDALIHDTIDATVLVTEVPEAQPADAPLPVGDESPETRLRKEVDSIKFYIDSGYAELAEKAINELRGEFGECSEIAELRTHLNGHTPSQEADPVVGPVVEKAATNGHSAPTNGNSGAFDLGEFRSELGFDNDGPADDSDYDTHYQTAIAYQEMGLLEQAIAEFQDAVNLVRPNDGSRRFFQCANLLGHCFMQNGMPKLALKWHQRTLETPDLRDDEKQAVWYEIASAYEAEGDFENAGKYFEQVYSENVDFRDVRSRLKNLMVSQ